MKRLLTAVLAGATLMTPLALPTKAAAQNWDGYRRDRDGNRDWDRDGDRNSARYRDRDDRRRWDRQRYNGYYYRQQWSYGPPPSAYYNDPYFDPGYRTWRRGDRLPSYYRDSYRDVDWRDCGLRPPPYGYRYVQDDRGDYLLVGIATGVILGIILGGN